MTVQPTEQWVQTFLRIVTVAPGGGGGPASALRTAAERQSAERGKAAGSEPRTAQEAATIDTAACLDRESGGKRAAAHLALRPLDQHGRLPHFAG